MQTRLTKDFFRGSLNSRYWYARSHGRRYEDFDDPRAELRAALEDARGG